MKKMMMTLVLLAGLWQGAAAQVGSVNGDTLWSSFLPLHNDVAKFARFNFDESNIYAGTPGGMIYVLDSKTGFIIDSVAAIFPRNNDNTAQYDYAFINGKNLLATSSGDSAVVINLDTKQIEAVFKDTLLKNEGGYIPKVIYNLALSSTKNQLLVTYANVYAHGDTNGSIIIHIYDLSTKNEIKTIQLGRGMLFSGGLYSPSGNQFITYINKRKVSDSKYFTFQIDFYDTKTLEKKGTYTNDTVVCGKYFSFSNDEQMLAISNDGLDGTTSLSVANDEFIRFIDLSTFKVIKKITTKSNELEYFAAKVLFPLNKTNILYGIGTEDNKHNLNIHLLLYNIFTNNYVFINDSLLKQTPSSLKAITLTKDNTKLLIPGYPYYLLNMSNILSVENPILAKEYLFPNPVNQEFTIKLSSQILEKLEVSVFDYSGKIFENLSNDKIIRSGDELKIRCDNFADGIYLIKVSSSNFSKTYKIVKGK